MSIRNLFKKKEVQPVPDLARDVRELLRENLCLLEMDKFYEKDPILSLTKEERLVYLKKFSDLFKDKDVVERLKYMINKQSQKTLWDSRNGVQDIAGASNINGIASVIDEWKRLAGMHIRESRVPDENPLDKFSVIPRVSSL